MMTSDLNQNMVDEVAEILHLTDEDCTSLGDIDPFNPQMSRESRNVLSLASCGLVWPLNRVTIWL